MSLKGDQSDLYLYIFVQIRANSKEVGASKVNESDFENYRNRKVRKRLGHEVKQSRIEVVLQQSIKSKSISFRLED
jgi:hypothetical protein